jgi:hypothetical protein
VIGGTNDDFTFTYVNMVMLLDDCGQMKLHVIETTEVVVGYAVSQDIICYVSHAMCGAQCIIAAFSTWGCRKGVHGTIEPENRLMIPLSQTVLLTSHRLRHGPSQY